MNHNIVLFLLLFSFFTADAQLGFCTGNSGDPIFTENFGTGVGNSMLPTGTTTYLYTAAFPDDGFYTVANGSFGNPFDWHEVEDHTPNDTNGKFLIVNAGFTPGEFYRTTVSGLCATTTYEFSAWLFNLLEVPSFCTTESTEIPVSVGFQIWDSTDSNLLASGTTPDIFATAAPTWEEYGLVFQTLADQNSVILKMINNGQGGCGNDVAIDDIEFKSCGDTITVTDAASNTSIAVCDGEVPFTTTLTANPDFEVFSSHFYQWQESSDGDFWTDVVGETNQTIDISISAPTFYRTKVAEVAVNLNNEQCNLLSDVFQITLNSSPNPPTSSGVGAFNCNLNEALLSVSVPSGITVNWYDSIEGGLLLQANSLSYTATALGTYYAEAVNNATGCASSERTALSPINIVPLSAISDGDVDFNCELNEAVLSVSVSSGVTVNWYDAPTEGTQLLSNSLSYTTMAEGTYYAEVVDDTTGCVSDSRTAISTSIFNPEAPVSNGDVNFECGVADAEISVSVSTDITVNWYDSETGGDLLLADSTIYSANTQGTFYAEAVDDFTGCTSLTRTAISVSGNLGSENCIIPQGISPGISPGLNDSFDLSSYAVTQLEIYNRYGTLVYSKNDYIDEWEGQTNDGKELPVGTYFYVMVYEGGSKNRSSWVYLNR